MTLQEFTTAWEAITLIKVFEIEVINKRTTEREYIAFHIALDGSKFVTQHEPLNTEQNESNMIAFIEIDIDLDFSIEENLQELMDACWHAINDSEYFRHVD